MKNIRKYNDFIKEEIDFNFDEEDLKEIENLKVYENDLSGIFLDYEEEFLMNLGLYKESNSFREKNKYYHITVTKSPKVVPGTAESHIRGEKIECFYQIYLSIILGITRNFIIRKKINSFVKEERIKILKDMLRQLHVLMLKEKIDPDSIREYEEKLRIHEENRRKFLEERRKQEEEMKKKREEEERLRLLRLTQLKDVDPYGEEKWEEEKKIPSKSEPSKKTKKTKWWDL